MKKFQYIISFLFFMISCGKDKELLPEPAAAVPVESAPAATERSTKSEAGAFLAALVDESLQPSAVSDVGTTCTVPTAGVTYANGMLCFTSTTAFRGVFAALDCQSENFSGYNAYMTQFGGDLYRIDSALTAMGIDEDKPLLDYESRYSGYVSLRKKLEADEEAFLAAGGDPASTANPGLHATGNTVLNTLLNSQGCVKVGDTLVKIFPNGVAYLVTDGNLNTLAQITDVYATQVFQAPNVIALWNEDNSTVNTLIPCNVCLNCSTNDQPAFTYTYNGKNYKFVTTIKVTNVPLFHAYTALSRNYVWKNGRWKKSRMYMYANVQQAQKTCRRIDGTNKRFPSSGFIYRKHVRAIYKSNIFHLLNQGSLPYQNTLYIAGEIGNLRAINGISYGGSSVIRTVILQ